MKLASKEDCVFCKIISGEIPCSKVYEDDLVFAFLDIAPINQGHILIVPKEHHASLTRVPAKYLEAMMRIAPVIGQAAMREIDGDGFNLHLSNGEAAGQIIAHAHLHVVPRQATDGFCWGHRTLSYENDTQRNEMAESIVKRMKL
ncbi:MAG: HIT family protein [Lentisphaeria bacterium]|nr:HIT family protein [Lentisphaeria bacterium]